MQKEYVSWQMICDFVSDIKEDYKNVALSGVYGVPRGGLILAVMISHKLNIPLLSAPCKDCLIVDDICDSGESLLHFFQNSSALCNKPLYHIVTMYYKKNNLKVIPEKWKYSKEDKWIVFPWESIKED